MSAFYFDVDETQIGDIVEAYVDNTDCTISLVVCDIKALPNKSSFVVVLQSIDTSLTWRYVLDDLQPYFIFSEDSEEEQQIYLSKRSKKRELTGIHRGSLADAETVYEAMTNDICVCSRIELSPDFLQTRSSSYRRI